MKVLIIGSGGREHALSWKIAKSQRVNKVYCAPGNGGTATIAENIDIKVNEIDKLVEFALKEEIDLTIVGPEDPLVLGIVDKFHENGLRIFGANKKSAQLEASKEFAKKFMAEYDIPTARYNSYTDLDKAIEGLGDYSYPVVIKADGLCLGKGVIICNTKEEAIDALTQILKDKIFGSQGEKVIIEEFLTGEEASLLCLVTEGKIIPMESARDYKRIFDEDKGENTGGVGCFSPSPLFTKELDRKIERSILNHISFGLENEGIGYRGILFIGLMIEDDEPKVLEFNVRFGDPETQVLIPRLEVDLIDIIQKTIDSTLNKWDLIWTEDSCMTVIATSKGYPGDYEKGYEIHGLNKLDKDIILFQNGTKYEDGKVFTNGGRVLSVTTLATDLDEAREKIYGNIGKIDFEGIFYRKDIGR